jgi:hypothetical protein
MTQDDPLGLRPVYNLEEAGSIIRGLATNRGAISFSRVAEKDMEACGVPRIEMLYSFRGCRAIDHRLHGDEWRYTVRGGGAVDGDVVEAEVAIQDITEELKRVRVRRVWKKKRG